MPENDAVIKRRVEQAVSDYIAYHRNHAIKELRFFRDMPTLDQAITRAAHACTAGGRKHSHQWRIPPDSLREFETRLSGSRRAIRKATSFDELHEIVREVGEPIYMIGELTIYDTAHRIGSKLRLLPTRVYLHRAHGVVPKQLESTAATHPSLSRNCLNLSLFSNHTKSRTAFASLRDCCRAIGPFWARAAGAMAGAVRARHRRRRLKAHNTQFQDGGRPPPTPPTSSPSTASATGAQGEASGGEL